VKTVVLLIASVMSVIALMQGITLKSPIALPDEAAGIQYSQDIRALASVSVGAHLCTTCVFHVENPLPSGLTRGARAERVEDHRLRSSGTASRTKASLGSRDLL
jgi:hypothetical protein